MCGITGFFSYYNSCDTKKYYKAHKKIAHRGPNDEGFLYKNRNENIELLRGDDTIKELSGLTHINQKESSLLLLGHRRLSIIDLSEQGHQPFTYENLYMVYNGEIFNYIELRDELIVNGYSFKTQTDTEVVLKAYHCWGVNSFNKFNGMWSIAIYDKVNDNVILTRDRFGIKPLYYSIINDSLIFGSEIKFVSSFLNKLQANEQMVYDYVENGYVSHASETFFKNIYQINSGHYAIYDLNGLVEKMYYKTKNVVTEDNITETKNLLFDAIKLRMRSDVKVGSLLSGGMDSSSIVCAIEKLKLASEFDTFTISYAQKELDFEEKYVKDIIHQTKFYNHSIYLEPDVDILDKLTYIIESPYRSFTESAMYKIYEHIGQNTNITVLLNGEGSDEIFSGYNMHFYYYFITLLLKGKFYTLFKEYGEFKRNTKKSHKSILWSLILICLSVMDLTKYVKKNTFYTRKYQSTRKVFSNNPLKNEILSNRFFSALPEYLNYADKISMNFSLEVRVPFLDYRLVNLTNGFKETEYIKNGVAKYTLREAMSDVVPKSVYERKDKKGFFTPHDLWLKTSLSKAIQKEIEDIKTNGLFEFINENEIYKYYTKFGANEKIWRIYCLSRWKKVWGVEC
jgi:asparagine synthase (glutamine-hydrolysing)